MSFSMGKPTGGSGTGHLQTPEGPYKTQLEYIRTNQLGARIYEDGLRRSVVQLKNPDQSFGLEHPVVKFEEGSYIDKEGTMYVVTNLPDRTDEFGNVIPENEIGDLEQGNVGQGPQTPRGKSVLTRVITPDWIPQDNKSIELFLNRETEEAFWRFKPDQPSQLGIVIIYEFKDPEIPGKVVYLDNTSEKIFLDHPTLMKPREKELERDLRPREHPRTVRPTQVIKAMKNYFDGSGDPYDHVAEFKQVLRAEQVEDLFTQYEAFGLTLKGTTLAWFQPLSSRNYRDIGQLLDEFIVEFSKSGIRHNTSSLIHSFKQTPQETVRLAGRRFRQYLERCPTPELPTPAKQVALFLDGLLSTKLRSYVYLKEPRSIEECVRTCIDIEDNLDSDSSTSHTSKISTEIEEIAEQVAKKLGVQNKQTQRVTPVNRCYTCGGDHMANICPMQNQNIRERNAPYCTIERKYTNHTAQDCPYNRQAPYYIPQQQYQVPYRPQPVLGNQPPAPANVIPVKYAVGEENPNRALVPLTPLIPDNDSHAHSSDYSHEGSPHAYYTESPEHSEIYSYQYEVPPMEQNWEPEYSNVMYTNPNPRPQLRQMRPQAPRGSCFRCQGDHFIRDCPRPPSPSQGHAITIQACCADCGKDHLPRDCPRNPSSAPKITPINVVGLVADSK
ncbi:hypothetical protein KP509_27G040800 [Ceratopteris richardii]|uniref:CCHC-type domain-containing protein n=1 Tax=Ceratopteris richardii TaxID=49495 RepID=A0A8T2RH93_CERRI|nr:hypothetical protein KP509_27G040800 [Ceratopteris richardii]